MTAGGAAATAGATAWAVAGGAGAATWGPEGAPSSLYQRGGDGCLGRGSRPWRWRLGLRRESGSATRWEAAMLTGRLGLWPSAVQDFFNISPEK